MEQYSCEIVSAFAERTVRRLWILCLVLLSALILTNLGWCYYESQFTDEVTTTIDASQDGSGYNSIINSGGYVNGSKSTDNNN